MTAANNHPIVIVGVGPVGLTAAAHLHEKRASFLVLERRETAVQVRLAPEHTSGALKP